MTSGKLKARILALLAVTLLTACASSGGGAQKTAAGIPEELRSGFLHDYSRLEPVAGEKAVVRWINPETDWRRYKRFMVEPVDSIVPPAYRSTLQPDPAVVAAITAYFREALAREIGSGFEITDRPGSDVARISVAITAIQPTSRQLSAWQYLPIPLIAAGVGELTGTRSKDTVVYSEGEISDSVNGEVLMQVMKGRVSQQGGARRIEQISPETVKPVLDFWATEYLRMIQEAKKKSGKRR